MFYDFLKAKDKLIIHDVTNGDPNGDQRIKPKTDRLMMGIETLKDQTFTPSLLSFYVIGSGNMQTMMVPFKHYGRELFGSPFYYDYRQKLTFKDGGQIYIDFKGDSFQRVDDGDVREGDEMRPVVFVVPGITSDQFAYYIRNIAEQMFKGGFDVVIINHRGLAGAELATPRMYCSNS